MKRAIRQQDYSASDAIAAHPVPTLIVDKRQVIVEANAAAESLFNHSRMTLINEQLSAILDLSHVDLQALWADDGKSFSAFDVVARLGRSGQHIIDLMVSPAHGEQGYRMIALPQSGASLSQQRPGSAARTAMGAAAMLAHEIKNPLSGIRGAAQLIEGASDEDASRFAQLICTEVDRIASLIDGMQNFSRHQPYALSLENIYPAINQAREIAKAGFANEVTIYEDYDPSLPEAMISHDGLVQILINLIKNAAEALVNTPKPMIKLGTAFRHGLSYDAGDGRGRIALPVEITVCDNGPGVPQLLVEDMFSPFVTGRDLESGKRGGQGLGLALVDKLMREMGGLVRYHRDHEQGLSYFRLHLPVSGAEA